VRLRITLLLLAGICISLSVPAVLSSGDPLSATPILRALPPLHATTPARWYENAASGAHSSHGNHDSRNMLPVAVNGAENPDAISDALAMRHFIRAVSISPNASIIDGRRRDALLATVGFGSEDYGQFVRAIHAVKDQLDGVDRARKGYSAATDSHLAALDALRVQERTILDRASSDVIRVLTPDGQSRLQWFVRERVKRHIVIYGGLP
jgi:hypothetical protein